MAIEKIKYKNKVAIKNDESLPEINKVTDENMNEIKKVINNNADELSLIKNQIPTGQATGNPIHIADSSNLEAKLRLNGGDKQVVTELGENILDSTEYNGIGITEDTNTGFGLSFLPLKLGEPLVPGNYSFAMFFTDGTVSGSNVSLNLYDSNNSLVTTSSSLFNFTEEQIAEIANYRIFTNTTGLELYMGKTIQGVMLVKGSTKPSVYKEFIHASPTPNNPSKVETVGSNVNEFDKDNANILNLYINPDGNIYSATNRKLLYIKSQPNTNYCISRIAGTYFRVASSATLPEVNTTTINKDVYNETATEKVLNTGENGNYLLVGYYNSDTDTLTEQEILDSLKIEEGNQATAYSPYGMGSVGIGVSNKNLAEIELGDINPTTGKENNAAKVFRSNYIRVKNGTTYVWSVNKTLTNPLNIRLYDIDKNYIGYASFSGQKTYTVTNKDIAYLRIRCDLVGEETIDGLIVQIEEGNTSTDIVEHEQQTKIMPIQQEMLEGDYIEDVEHHGWNKKILTGNESYGFAETSVQPFRLNLSDAEQLTTSQDIAPNVYCSHFTPVAWNSSKTELEAWITALVGKQLAFGYRDITTLEDWKAYLAEQYTAGTPVTIYYKLATPIDLELTEEQKEAKEINTYKNVTNVSVDNELATLDVTYKKDLETVNKNYEDRIAALEAAILS